MKLLYTFCLLLFGSMFTFAVPNSESSPPFPIFGYDGRAETSIAYDRGFLCDFGYDSASAFLPWAKENRVAGADCFFARFAEFVAAKGGTKLLPQFTGSTIDDVVASAARARSARITEGGRAIAKKLGHAESGGYTSAFQGVAPTQANAESLIRNIMSKPSVTDYGHTWIDVYNSAGQGVRFGAQNGYFEGFIELQLRTR